jgi:hypothetical protein
MTPAQAAAAIGVQPNTLRKWTLTGLRLKSGERLILHCRKIGGRLDVSQDDIDRFNEALTADRSAPAPRPVSERDKRVMASLEARGW